MIEITNRARFGRTIAEALVKIDKSRTLNTIEKTRWINALAKAAVRIEKQGTWMTWQAAKNTLLIWSESNEIYEAGKTCQCAAFETGFACWHRAAARIIKNYLTEGPAGPSAAEIRNAPYLKQSSNRAPEKLGRIRI